MQLQLLFYYAGGLTATYAALTVLQSLWTQLRSPLRLLRGPRSPSWFYGMFRELISDKAASLQEELVKEYGTTFRVKGLMNVSRSTRIRYLCWTPDHGATLDRSPVYARFSCTLAHSLTFLHLSKTLYGSCKYRTHPRSRHTSRRRRPASQATAYHEPRIWSRAGARSDGAVPGKGRAVEGQVDGGDQEVGASARKEGTDQCPIMVESCYAGYYRPCW
jgi:hypothetical protein